MNENSRSTTVLAGSSPENGSSITINSGSCKIPPMNCTFCCIPLESSSTFFPVQALKSKRSHHALARRSASAPLRPLSCARNIKCSSTFIFLYSPRSSGR